MPRSENSSLRLFTDRNIPDWILQIRIPILIGIHLIIFSSAWLAAYVIRFDGHVPADHLQRCLRTLPWICGIQLATFLYFKSFHGWWRYVTFRDLIALAVPLVVAWFIIVLADQFLLGRVVPRSVPVIQMLVAGFILASLRSSYRVASEVTDYFAPDHRDSLAFIISNHHETLVLANQVNCQRGSSTRIVGILTSDRHRRGTVRAGIPIVGRPEDAPKLAEKLGVTQVWLMAGALPGNELASLKKIYDEAGLITKVIPRSTDYNLDSTFIPLRDIDINDLLRRPSVQLDDSKIRSEITGCSVMVTGAGGSIGSELCRQLLRFRPSHLILVEHRENSVFLIQNELVNLARDSGIKDVTIVPAVGDILDRERMMCVFEIHNPQYVYHAAAHKHVGLMEVNAGEALKNNIAGTRQVADLSNEFGVTKFVLVSTDKAVNPTSVMGCTKQIAERYVLSLGSQSRTKYVVVRFGNVLGSNGSVVPIFREQIARGGPITITHANMTRFFMTIPEASQLILQSGSMGEGGEIFVLDMGEQVRIVDLAEKMIELAGLPPSAIEIQFVGARPGEKLYEELYFDEEESIKTPHPKIFACRHRTLNYEDIVQCVDDLVDLQTEPNELIRHRLKFYIPEYQQDAAGTAATEEPETAAI